MLGGVAGAWGGVRGDGEAFFLFAPPLIMMTVEFFFVFVFAI